MSKAVRLYIVTTPDRYELITFFSESARKVAEFLGITENTVYGNVWRGTRIPEGAPRQNAFEQYRIRKIMIEEEDA